MSGSKLALSRPAATRATPRARPTGSTALVAGGPSIGLALGGGGARGLAHVLVLEVFDELGIRPARIAGTSIGALYGAAYASGLSAKHIRALTEETLSSRFDVIRQLFAARSDPVGRLMKLLPVRRALLDPLVVLDLVLPPAVDGTFEDLGIPLEIVATDLGTHAPVVVTSGPLRPAIAASIAIPVLFAPVALDGQMLVDGGLVSPLPYDLVTGKADITVAIDVCGGARGTNFETPPTMIETAVQSLQIMQKAITRERLRSVQPDIYIEVEMTGFGALDFLKAKAILAAAVPAKDRLKRQLERVLTSHTLPSG